MRDPKEEYSWLDWCAVALIVLLAPLALLGAYFDVLHALETGVIR